MARLLVEFYWASKLDRLTIDLLRKKFAELVDLSMNKKQEAFCYFYVELGNGCQAAIRAGYSSKSAKQQAHRLLTYDDVLFKIEEIRGKLISKMEIRLEDIVHELVKIAFSDLNELVRIENGMFVLNSDCDLNLLSAIKFYKSKKKYSVSLKRFDRILALNQLAMILGFHNNNERKNKQDALSLSNFADRILKALNEIRSRKKVMN